MQYMRLLYRLLTILDDSRLAIYFKVIGISYYFIFTMKLAPNFNIFYAFPKYPRWTSSKFWKKL